jgi:hypothetical protein
MKLSESSIDRIVSVFDGIDLGDPRRARRLKQTVRKLSSQPQATLPEALGSEAEIEGAYRFMNSGHVAFESLTKAHARATAERARSEKKVLAIHDTTTFKFAHADPEEVGYLSTGKAGFAAHYTLIVAADSSRRPLGITNVEPIFRARPPAKRKAKGRSKPKQNGDATTKNKDRESQRWFRGLDETTKTLEGCEVIHVGDRETDNYALFSNAIQSHMRFVFRVRVKARVVETKDGFTGSLTQMVKDCPAKATREVSLSTRQQKPTADWSKSHPPRAERVASLSFSAISVGLDRPRYHDEGLLPSLQLNVVRVFEAQPPKGAEPVEWLLYTTEPIKTRAQIEEIVDIYRTRWLIEECNKALKTGCRYEQHQFEGRDALLNLLAMTLPIACELLWLRASSRERPNAPAAEVLNPTQIEILSTLGSRKLSKKPTVRDALWAVAALGGHIKNNGEPGWLVLHRGMMKLTAYEQGWTAALMASRTRRLPISR